jgi:hypothetical protein
VATAAWGLTASVGDYYLMTDLNDPLSDEMEVLNVLLSEGIEQRYLTYDQILEALPEIENNIMLLETLLEEAQTLGIAIYENEDDVVAVALGAPDDEADDSLASRSTSRKS